MNGLALNDILKLSRLISDLNGSRDVLIARLLADYSAAADRGVGYQEMILLFSNLADTNAAGTLAGLMAGLNTSLTYNGNPVTSTVGMVRLLKAGVVYKDVTFPGLGGVHIATMMNGVTTVSNLAFLINYLGLEQMAPLVGCADKVEDPDFRTPCTAIKSGW
jgi:hypothetical protein